jgi:glucose-6-phosphate isomerase
MDELIFNYTGGGVSEKELLEQASKLDEYRLRLSGIVERGDFLSSEASLCLPTDMLSHKIIEDAITRFSSPNLKYIVVVGIGGSNLGTIALHVALFGTQNGFEHLPKLLFLDTTSTKKMRAVLSMLKRNAKNAESFVINLVCKSGETTETIANFETLYKELSQEFGDIKSRVVVSTDKSLKLWKSAEDVGFSLLSIPKQVGGRFSVLSSVGLFPLGLSGVDIKALLEGARVMRDKCLSEEILQNPAIMSAILLYYYYQKGITIHNNFYFASELEQLGKWCRQLTGESLGKECDATGKTIHSGITPIVSMGTTDLHSMAQLYFGGPRDKFTAFVSVWDRGKDVFVPDVPILEGLISGIGGKSLGSITDAIYRSVEATYKRLELPFLSVAMPDVSPYTLGQYLQYKMMETMFLAKLFNINAFDQPSVKEYKQEARRILEERED